MQKVSGLPGCVLARSFVFFVLSGCGPALVGSAETFDDMAHALRARGDYQVVSHAAPQSPELQQRIETLLSANLNERDAVALALLNSRSLQAHLQKLAVTHGEKVQETTPKNPLFTFLGRVPLTPGAPFGETNFLQSIVELALLPWRRQQANIDMQRVRFELGQTVLDTVRDVRVAYHQAQAAERVALLRRTMLMDVQRASELADFRSRSQNVDDVQTALARATYQQMKIDLARAELDLLVKRESLVRLLGLQRVPVSWALLALPEVPDDDLSLTALEEVALHTRMDIAAADIRVKLLAKALNLTESSSFVGTVLVGGAINYDDKNFLQVGPTLVVELPIFNRRQGQIESLRAALRQAEYALEQLRLDARSHVRRAYGALMVAKEISSSYVNAVLPLRHRITEIAARDAGALEQPTHAWDVVLARQADLHAQCEWAEAAHGYWQQRAHLEHAVGSAFLDKYQAGDASPKKKNVEAMPLPPR